MNRIWVRLILGQVEYVVTFFFNAPINSALQLKIRKDISNVFFLLYATLLDSARSNTTLSTNFHYLPSKLAH